MDNIAAVTGHRPDKLGREYDGVGPYSDRIRSWLWLQVKTLDITQGISGMALGTDMLWAEVCIELGIPFVAAVPCDNQDKMWPQKSKDRYKALIAKAERVVNVSPGPYAAWKMQRRNIWMIDNSGILLSVYDGTQGGTRNCIEYAKGQQIKRPDYKILTLNPNLC